MWRRTKTVVVIGAAALPLLLAPAAQAAQTGSTSFSSGSGTLVVSYALGCGTSTTNTTTWRPWVDVNIVEKGNTAWRKVRVTYLDRRTEETFIRGQYTGDITPPNSTFNPPKYTAPVLTWDPYGGYLDFSPKVGFKVAVSKDGKTFTGLTSHFLNCLRHPTL